MQRHSLNIHERFLRHIWSKQYLKSDLQTESGHALKVIEVGQLNSDGGPDFHNAKIKLKGVTYTGDIEIHRTVVEWIQHRHQKDPRYNKVILHVVLDDIPDAIATAVQSGRRVPVLVLGKYLSESIHTIWQKAILDERSAKSETIPCSGRNDDINAEVFGKWLTKLAIERLELKLRRFEERLKQLAFEDLMTVREKQGQYGRLPVEGNHDEIPPPFPELTQKDFTKKELWEQILYEGVMEGLGYSKNREPFLKLAQNLTLRRIRNYLSKNSVEDIESLFFGIAGLIPKISTLKEKESREYVRKLARRWKMLKSSVFIERLHSADWQFFPTRPSNFPSVRLVAAYKLAEKFLTQDMFRKIIQTLKSYSTVQQKEDKFFELFSVDINDFWNHHYNFDDMTPKSLTLLGNMRIHEIVINTVLPVALLYARIFKDKTVRDGAIDFYNSMSSSDNNSITRLMEKQLLKGRITLRKVSHQQAAIQLYKYYCTEKKCSECEISKWLL